MAQLKTRIVLRNDSLANWLANSTKVLLKGEVGIEFDANGQAKIKIGDGVKTWAQLDYYGNGGVELFTTLAAAQEAAATATAADPNDDYYFGQTLMVVEDEKATLYMIQPDKSLSEVGLHLEGDNKGVVTDNGLITLLGLAEAPAGAHLVKGDGDAIEWAVPNTETVDGLNQAVGALQTDVGNLKTDKANKTDVYTRTEIDTKISSVYRYMGSVNAYSDLPTTGQTIGDTYNVATANKTHNIKAGDNVAWTASGWDVLAGVVDLTGYVEKVDGSRLMTEAEGTKLASIASGAQVNTINSVSNEFVISADGKQLSINAVPQSKVTGLVDALADLTQKANTAQANVLEAVKVNGTALAISGKAVNIPIAIDALGVVKTSTAQNGVSVNTDGTMTVNNLNVSKLVQSADESLILSGGSADD